jgi:hypothetical protein
MGKYKLKEKEREEFHKPSRYDVDSGEIFTELQNTYKKYSTDFLTDAVWQAYRQLFASVPIISFPTENDSEPKNYLEHQNRLYKHSLNGETKEGIFPFHDCYIFYHGKEPIALGYFAHRYKVKSSDPYFDLFFTLKILQTDLMILNEFLEYQLSESFEGNKMKYSSFLKAISSKYSELLEEKYVPPINHFIEQESENEIVKNEPESTASSYTLTRQVLFLYYLLKKAGVESKSVVDITEISRIVQGITSRQLGAKDISNTDIYKRLRNPLKETSSHAFQKDLRFVRDLFEKLSLLDVVAEINKEITDRD